MNKQGRKEMDDALSHLYPVADADSIGDMTNEAISTAIDTAKDILTSLMEGEREKFDNMPEGLQQGEKGQAIEQAADALEAAVDRLEEAIDLVGRTPEAKRSEDELAEISDKTQEAIDETDNV